MVWSQYILKFVPDREGRWMYMLITYSIIMSIASITFEIAILPTLFGFTQIERAGSRA